MAVFKDVLSALQTDEPGMIKGSSEALRKYVFKFICEEKAVV